MRTIFIGAGHSNVKGKDRGAKGNGYIEGELAVELRDLIAKELRCMGATVIVDDNKNVLWETIRYFKNKTTSDSIVLDIHWNAAGPTATGVETLVPSKNSKFERYLAARLSDTVSRILGIRKRGYHLGLAGVKTELESHHGRLGWMKLTGENVLLETCFITNAEDMQAYQANKIELAQYLAMDLYEASIDTFIDKTTDDESILHIVTVGDTLGELAAKYSTTIDWIKRKNNLRSDTIYIGQTLIVG